MKLQGIAPKLLVSERIESKYLPALLNEFSGILSDHIVEASAFRITVALTGDYEGKPKGAHKRGAQ